jgi:homoserine/homoserine lactone efflux protein
MELTTWIAYLVATIILCVSPGPGALASMSAGMKYGWVRGMWNCLGMQFATAFNVLIIALGLGAILMASETVFHVMKWCGALYLVWLGIQKWCERVVPFEEIAAKTEFKDTTRRGIFMQGFWVNLTNPKGLIFLLAVLPQFIDPAKPTAMQYVILTLTLNVVDLIVMACYTGLAAKVLRLLKDPSHIKATNRVLGSLFIAAGGALAVFKRGG